ncbi:hypothetical protein QVD17_31712 [Tagetes erecta]|uniref:Ribosomal protein L34Ae n=1 Tax=Tagetes erecta TaxID=13708 RepID=A0AAD8NNR9_TARER|nr:hypothetical protein QVD17_31712 [Tagetes erecta]
MIKLCSFIWVLLCDFVFSSFRHLIEHLAGSRVGDTHEKSLGFSEREEGIVQSSGDLGCSIFDGFDEEMKSEFTFGFQYQMKEEDLSLINYNKGVSDVKLEETGDVVMENGLTTTMSTSKYQFVSVKDFGGFVVEPESGSFTVHEMFVEPPLMEDDFIIKEKGLGQDLGEVEDLNVPSDVKVYDFIEKEGYLGQVLQMVDDSNTGSIKFEEELKDFVADASSCDVVQELKDEKVNDCTEKEVSLGQVLQRVRDLDTESIELEDESKDSVADASCSDGVQEPKDEKVNDFTEKEVSSGQVLQTVDNSNTESIKLEDESKDGVQELHDESGVLKLEQVNWLGEFLMKDDSFCYGFDLSDESESDHLDYHLESDDSGDGYFSICPKDVDSVIEPESENLIPSFTEELDDDYIELEPNIVNKPHVFDSNVKRESDSCFDNSLESENERKKSWEFDSDEEDDADVLLEHQELIGQMKMELRNSRTGGLPTILEECETPRVKEDYKPLQINEKLEHRDQMAEIQKFYKSYTEKMRKLDVLNYQTLQAINFLKMKHPDQTNTGENTSLSALKSVVLPSLWPCKLRRIYADPTLKSITELHKDLEIVYVGQACLSWEILHWQYKKAKELQLYDPQGYRSYNQTAIEFQQFHVLLRRFTEDELFQGPRVQNYTKQRCTLRGLLQVPPIRDDNLKEKKAMKKEGEDAVSISTMAKMIKESMMVFWEFLHTDKDTTNLFLTIILQGSKAHLQDPADCDLFTEIKTIHQKKERRLKDMLRTGNCIVKKFQKQQETILDQHMFVSQVELRLVSRVLSLPRLSRDQLVWCQSKLNNIKFIDRKIRVEDSLFLLFPC